MAYCDRKKKGKKGEKELPSTKGLYSWSLLFGGLELAFSSLYHISVACDIKK